MFKGIFFFRIRLSFSNQLNVMDIAENISVHFITEDLIKKLLGRLNCPEKLL